MNNDEYDKYEVVTTQYVFIPKDDTEFGMLLDYIFAKNGMNEEDIFESMRELRDVAWIESGRGLVAAQEHFRRLRREWAVESLLELDHIGDGDTLVQTEDQKITKL